MNEMLTDREVHLIKTTAQLTNAELTRGTSRKDEERQYKVVEAAKHFEGLVSRRTITEWCKLGRIGTRGKGRGKTSPYYVTISEIRRVSGLDRSKK